MMRLLSIFGLLSCLSAFAQNETQLVKAEFRVFPVLNIEKTGVFYQPEPEAEMIELTFRHRARSIESYEYNGEPTIRFYREDGRDEEGVMQYRTVGQVDVMAGEMLIFFAEARKGANNLEFSLLALDDSPNGLPMDHVTFLNFTPIPLNCRFMDRDMVLTPGENKPISVEKRLNQDIFIGLAVTSKNTHRVVLKSRWQFHKGNRHHILLLPPPREGSFRMRAFRITEFVGEDQRFNGNRMTPVIIEDSGVTQL
jgi:hypothetical protein